MEWAHDKLWFGMSTRKRTVHVFALNPLGGKPDGSSHFAGRVVNAQELGLFQATPRTFPALSPSSGFSSTLNFSSAQNKEDVPQSPRLSDDDENDENRPLMSMPVPQVGAEELPFPPTSKPKRAPIPLDFKHPVSTNTVPAGLFKALVNNDGEERTRRTVRSRLSSRDIYEHSPSSPSMICTSPPISPSTWMVGMSAYSGIGHAE
ncbi:hypothetical protein NUW54_g14441 [Trametes sanguinea]|uniref:Uncharacterized protein n=1 Tax=Trametes sanguinea TaxID=158606 RepID=A0ACC1MD78_9APHY|nr:hypothetical protein NUW54_g14441 [Trametes sanguinea]